MESIGSELSYRPLPQATGEGTGVFGASGSGAGVSGQSDTGAGIFGISQANDGIVGGSEAAGKSGVFGFNDAAAGFVSGVAGRANSPNGQGVNGFSDAGVGVRGFSRSNYGGVFDGGRAPLLLKPANTPGRPTTGNHQRGELFVDSNGDLFYCKDSGTPGNWFRVRLTPA